MFVGVARQIKELAFKANYEMILEPEWGGTLSRIAVNVGRYETVYWLTLYPVLVFSIAIIGINLTGEGLRIEFQKRESRVISSIRKAYYMVSPRIFIYQIKDIKQYYKPVIVKTLIIVVIIAYSIIPWHQSIYEFDLDYAKQHLEELTKDKYGGRVTGTEGGHLAGEYIIDTLNSYGYQVDTVEIPLTNDDGTTPGILTPMVIESGWIKLTDEKGEEKTYYLDKDFTIITLNKNIFMDKPRKELHYKGVIVDPQNIKKIPEGAEVFAISRNLYTFTYHALDTSNYIKIGPREIVNYDIQFVLNNDYDRDSNTYLFKSTSIIPFEDLKLELENGCREIEINFDYPKLPKYQGRNITAFLPGKGKTKEDPGELIMIGASYDGVHINGNESSYAMTSTPAATALEVARMVSLLEEPLEKSVQFIFWDNEFEVRKYSLFDGSNNYCAVKTIPMDMAMSHGYYYFDISYPGLNEDEALDLIAYQAQRADKSNYLMIMELEKRLKQLNVNYRRFYYDYTPTRALMHMRLNALTSFGVGNTWTRNINSVRDTKESINYERMKSMGQIIFDTVTMNPYVMD